MKFLISSVLLLQAVVFCTAQVKHAELNTSPYENKFDTFQTGKLICTQVSGANEGNNCFKIHSDGQLVVLLATWEGDSMLDVDQEYCLLENKNCVTISADGKVHVVPYTWELTATESVSCTGYDENSKEINCFKVNEDTTIELLPATWVFPYFL